jgi:hypothetical protein
VRAPEGEGWITRQGEVDIARGRYDENGFPGNDVVGWRCRAAPRRGKAFPPCTDKGSAANK